MAQRFHIPRATAHAQLHATTAAAHKQKPEPLPAPKGEKPYRLDLADVIGADAIAKIKAAGKLVFQTVGDTGGVKHPEAQENVAAAMERQFETLDPAPSFFFHLGDIVYYYGQRALYYDQFYDPYIHYPGPIFAGTGNHDSAVTPENDSKDPPEQTSLDGFMTNFCADPGTHTPEAGEAPRLAMTQPNPYWTLTAPFATIVALSTNVPEHGYVEPEQEEWFAGEIDAAAKDKALVVVAHHPVYSADAFHGSSPNIGKVLDDAFKKVGRSADLVLNGHVHNYQRFTRDYNGRAITYVVAGNGGYYHLHRMGLVNGQLPPPNWEDPELGVTLNSYNQTDYGFLTLSIGEHEIEGNTTDVRKPSSPGGAAVTAPGDHFTIPLV